MKIVRESISFERGKKPRESMGIGLDGAIHHYFKENYDDVPLDYSIIQRIQEEEDLDDETKKEWIEHLLKKDPNKYAFEDPELYWFDENNFDYLEALGDGFERALSIDLFKKNGKFYVRFPDMSYLADLFDTHRRDISRDTIAKVLGGDAWEIFEYSVPESEAKDYIDNHWNDIKAVGYMMDIYNYRGGKEEDPDKVLEDIYSNDDFEDIRDSITNAVSDAQASAIETEAYNHMKKEVLDHYEMGEPDWDDKEFTASITKEGANKLFRHALIGEDGLEYYEPRGGYYDASIKPEWVSESLMDKLEHLP